MRCMEDPRVVVDLNKDHETRQRTRCIAKALVKLASSVDQLHGPNYNLINSFSNWLIGSNSTTYWWPPLDLIRVNYMTWYCHNRGKDDSYVDVFIGFVKGLMWNLSTSIGFGVWGVGLEFDIKDRARGVNQYCHRWEARCSWWNSKTLLSHPNL